MSERVSLELIAGRLAALQEGMRDLRDSHESLADRVSGIEVSMTSLGDQVLRTLTLHDRRIARVDQRLDAMTRRMERLEEAQLRLADMLADTRRELEDVRREVEEVRLGLADTRRDLAVLAEGQAEVKGMVAEVLRRLAR